VLEYGQYLLVAPEATLPRAQPDHKTILSSFGGRFPVAPIGGNSKRYKVASAPQPPYDHFVAETKSIPVALEAPASRGLGARCPGVLMVSGNKAAEAEESGFSPPGAADVRAAGVWQWAILSLCGLGSLACYFLLPSVAPDLAETVASHTGEVVPWLGPSRPAPAPEGADRKAGWFSAAPVRYGALLAGLFTAYGLALLAVARRISRTLEAAAFGLGAAFLAVQVTTPVLFSSDVYYYTTLGRVFTLYHVNPAIDVSVLPDDDPYRRLWNEDKALAAYGPLWTLISGGLSALGGERVGLTVLLFRALAALAVLGGGAALWGCLRRLAPHRAAQGLVFFLWNPLVVLEAGMSGHNDAAMVALFLFGIAAHVFLLRGALPSRHEPLRAVRFSVGAALTTALFVLSALVKYPTGVLVPIYLLMVCRQMPSWRARGLFLAGGAAGAALAGAVVFGLLSLGAYARPAPASGTALPEAALENVLYQRYTNSLHELLFRELRLWMGEEEDDVRNVEFRGWWVTTKKSTDLCSGEEPRAPVLRRLEPDTPLLVIAWRWEGHPWYRVYSPTTGQKGYVRLEEVSDSEAPSEARADPDLIRWWKKGRSPTAARIDAWLRLAMWSAFGLAWLWAAWYASDLRRFLAGSAALMLAACWLIASWVFPWYVIWPLAFAAFVPASWPALLAALLSATVLTLYATIGYDNTGRTEWIFTYRSLPAFAMPLLLFLVVALRHWLPRRWPRQNAARGRPVQ